MEHVWSALCVKIGTIACAGMADSRHIRRCGATIVVCLLSGLIAPPTGSAQEASALEKCVLVGSVLPLIGGPSDTPLVRSTIDGHDVAIFVSPEISKLLIRDVSDEFWFPHGGSTRLMAQDNQMVDAEQTTVDQLRIGQFQIGPLPGFVIDPTFPKDVGGLPIIGVVGRNILVQGVILMIDIPHGSLALFKWDYEHCGSATTLLGQDAHVAPLSAENATNGTVSGKRFEIHFDPDLAYNSFPGDDIERIHLTDKQLATFPQINLRFAEINVGRLSGAQSITLHGNSIGAQQFLIQKQVSRVVLGNPFFRTRTVLFDFTRHQISYLDVRSSASRPSGSGRYHFDMTYVPRTSVSESAGLPRPLPSQSR